MAISKFEELLEKLGTGKWNFMYFLAAAYCYLLLPSQAFSGVYLAPDVGHTCIPPVDNPNVTGISEDSCSYFVNKTTTLGDQMSEVPCTDWHFNTSVYTSTLTSEFKLVCDRGYLRATYQSIASVMSILSTPLSGIIADRLGRKPVLTVSLLMYFLIVTVISFMKNFTAILALRFLLGCFPLTALYIVSLEVCELKNRSLVGILIGLPWAFGTMLWGGLAYLIRDWKYLQLAVAIPFGLTWPFIYLIGESPRWLILKGKHDQALKVLRKASRWNKKDLPSDQELKKTFLDIQKEQLEAKMKHEGNATQNIEKRRICSTPKLLRTTKMRILMAVLCLNLFSCYLIFSGLSLSGQIYSADPFLYIIIGGLMEAPSYIFPGPLINWIGRKTPTIAGYFISGVTLFALAFIPSDMSWLLMTFAMLGKLSNSTSFMILFVYMSELLPTEVRSQGNGMAIAVGVFGTIIAPYITDYLGPIIPWFSSVLFGILSFVAGLSLLPLPETLGTSMPETIQDLEVQKWKSFKLRKHSSDEEETTNLTT